MKRLILFVCLFSSLYSASYAQETFPRNDVRNHREGAYAFTNGTIVVDYQNTVQNGTMLIRDGKIEQVGSGISVPAGYTIIDLKGNYVYPSIIDPYTNYGMPKEEGRGGFSWGGPEQIYTKTKGPFNGNEAIKAEFNAAENFSVDKKTASGLRENGFGTVLTFRADGIARGTSALVTLDESSDNNVVLNSSAAAHYSFTKGSSKQSYPISTMGFIALMRQTYLDAKWYKTLNPPPFKDLSLESFNKAQSLPQIYDTKGWLEILRADKLGDEFGVQYIIKGGGDEYQRIDEVKATRAKLIIPLNYPAAFDVDNPLDAKEVSLADMKHWELAPGNAAALAKNGIEFAFTADGLSSAKDYLPNVRKAVEYGLSEQAALRAMTYTPASLLKATDQVGSLEKGKLANFIITSKSIFDDKASILENWVQGNKYQFKALEGPDYAGKYDLKVGSDTYKMEISGDAGSQSAKLVINDSTDIKVTSTFGEDLADLTFSPDGQDGLVRLSGWSSADGFAGKGQLIDGTWVSWSAKKTGDIEAKEKEDSKKEASDLALGKVIYPFVGHGNETKPTQETILIKNATLWTNEAEGIVENTDILLKDGKIAQIGKGLSASGARVIDAKGKHVTSGIIDEHSHIGASSINDIATNSSMVRIGDVIDPTDGHIYTSLSGGVTAVQILHGSANPIGGQSALIKLRWGASPEEMKIKGADGYIKFALGENVKRSSNPSSIRFPQTRMGVEQVYVDAFSSALEYKKKWDAYNRLSSKAKASATAPRRDLAMETMNEILEGKRFISCHSYVQSEINMLMNVADRFDFRVNTFTHILEGYKVADKMAEHGVGASTFSDWWAYKWEVRYAIPYNAAIMHNAGVTTAINSDDSEMGRRLNQEAAKSIKYGGMSQEDAWKMVTLNPAKLLHLDDRMGSLKVGKDADVVIWSDNPLSIYAKVESTIVDGTVYYDAQKEMAMVDWIEKERARLIQKMKAEKQGGGRTQKPSGRHKEAFHCDDLTVDLNFLND
ncbi:amidohydrolase family protein [Fulvivirga lutimaris]|uniref:amidohydrolase family protein n=1 Tax=Fulvivirga lutimaris TaxID=1819566 RepID=UPI0012BD406E|nr:amidohydrolase family protein [Fulvivirga lutimaris]MTI40669.1 amidohydrolase [Fulvivirga lutimaris]